MPRKKQQTIEVLFRSPDLNLPYPNNPNEHPEAQLKAFEASIREFGQFRSVVVDENNVILAGHGQNETCRRMGIDARTEVWPGLSDDQKRLMRLTDKRITELGVTDVSKVFEELDALDDTFKSISVEVGFGDEFFDEFALPSASDDDLLQTNTPTEPPQDPPTDKQDAVITVRLPEDDGDSFQEQLEGLLARFPVHKLNRRKMASQLGEGGVYE